ncbi:MAG: OsmC family protein [Xanthomonadales bacterium]|nr:OsmC family protein [Xanthomonadales bacterium]
MSKAASTVHEYHTRITWLGAGTAGSETYASYERTWQAEVDGKAPLSGSADAAFRGDPSAWNPEECLLTAVSACHMLFFLALCARNGVRVLAYRDDARAELRLHADGGGALHTIVLRARARLASANDAASARVLYERAGHLCFIARSLATTVDHAIEFESCN